MEVFSNVPFARDDLALQVHCSPDAVLAYEQWMTYPMRALYDGPMGTTIGSIVRAFGDGYLGANTFPLRDFDIFVVHEGDNPDEEGFFVTVHPERRDWLDLLRAQIKTAIGADFVRLSDGSGVEIGGEDISRVVARHTDVFVARAGEAPAQRTEAAIGAAIGPATPAHRQMEIYATVLSERVYKDNSVKHLKRYVKKKKAAYAVAESVARELGLDAVLTGRFASNKTEFYKRVAAFIRSNARDAVAALERNSVPVDNLRRTFVKGFAAASFQSWIGAPLVAAAYSDEESSSGDDEEEHVGDMIDCEYETYSDLSDDEQGDVSAPLLGNLVRRSKLVSFKLERRAKGQPPKQFGWLGGSALEPGDIIHVVVHAAPKPKKKGEVAPTSAIVDFQMKSRGAKSAQWLTVNTVELALPTTGKAMGTSFVVPLDNALFRAVVRVRRPGVGWQMMDVEGTYDFTVDPLGTRDAKRTNYPITWEQVLKVRLNAALRAKHSIPEFVFHARLINTAPYPHAGGPGGDVVDYFTPGEEQLMDDERARTLHEQKTRGFAEFVKEYNDGVVYKSELINEVRQLIWAINNGRTYAAALLKGSEEYDSEYVQAQTAIGDELIESDPEEDYETAENLWEGRPAWGSEEDDGEYLADAISAKGQEENLWDNRPAWGSEEDEAGIDARMVTIPPEPPARAEPSVESAALFAVGRVRPGARPFAPASVTNPRPAVKPPKKVKAAPAAVAPALGTTVLTPAVVTTTTIIPGTGTGTGTGTSGAGSGTGTGGAGTSGSGTGGPPPKTKGLAKYTQMTGDVVALEVIYGQIDPNDFPRITKLMDTIRDTTNDIEDQVRITGDYVSAVDRFAREVRPDFLNVVTSLQTAIENWRATNDAAIQAAIASPGAQKAYDDMVALEADLGSGTEPPTLPELDDYVNNRNELLNAIAAAASGGAASSTPPSPPRPPTPPPPVSLVPAGSKSSKQPSRKSSRQAAKKAAAAATQAPVTESLNARVSIDALFSQLEQEQTGASLLDTAADYVAMAANALRHTFDKLLGAAIDTMDPKYFGGVFVRGRRYVILLPSDATWKKVLVSIKKGERSYMEFLRDHAFEVPDGTLFAHSRRVELRSLSGKNAVVLKRTHDPEHNVTTVQMSSSLIDAPISGRLDTNIYTDDYKVHTVKMQDWTDFSA